MTKIIYYTDLITQEDGVLMCENQKFNGIYLTDSSMSTIRNGLEHGAGRIYIRDEISYLGYSYKTYRNGYDLGLESTISYNLNPVRTVSIWDMDNLLEDYYVDEKGNLIRTSNIYENMPRRKEWEDSKIFFENDKNFDKNYDLLPFFNLQNELKEKVIVKDDLPSEIKYIGGVDVAYNELEERVVAGIVILDAQTLQLVEEVTHEDKVSFPYVPGLFSFREVPPLLEAFKKLKTKPDLIVCDGHGIAHPKGVGMATHLGIELNIPTIGCAKKRLVGYYEEPESKRGSNSPMIFASKEVGKALRTQDGVKPVFVSVGHKISIETACKWILHLTPNYRLPETTRAVDSLVNKLMKERTDWDTPLEFYQKRMEEQQKEDLGTQQ